MIVTLTDIIDVNSANSFLDKEVQKRKTGQIYIDQN